MNKYDQVVDSVSSYWLGAITLLIFAAVIALPQIRDGFILLRAWALKTIYRNHPKFDTSPIVIDTRDEQVTFTELLRSAHYDVVKIHAHTHMLGVSAEHEWVRRRYPDGEWRTQQLTTLERLSGKTTSKIDPVHFDIITVYFPNGKRKKIYFDISSFFGGGISDVLQPGSSITKKLEILYK